MQKYAKVAFSITCVEVFIKLFRVSLTACCAACFQPFPVFLALPPAQHLCVNLFHLMDALDLEGVPDLEMSSEPRNLGGRSSWDDQPSPLSTCQGPGVPLKCTRDGPIASICYPDIGIGWNNAGAQGLLRALGVSSWQ